MVAGHMGGLLKEIRQAKGLTLRDVAGPYLSVSFLSKFERGETEISLSRFLSLLENLNMDLAEFYGVYQEAEPTLAQNAIAKAGLAYQENNALALKKYEREERAAYQKTGRPYHLHYAIMMHSFYADLTGEEVPEADMKALTDYLFGVEYWGLAELILLGNAMSAIQTTTLNLLLTEMRQRTLGFGTTQEKERLRIQLYINGLNLFLARRELALAKRVLVELSDSGIPETWTYERLLLHFAKGQLAYFQGQTQKGEALMKECLTIGRMLGMEQVLLRLESVYDERMLSSIEQ